MATGITCILLGQEFPLHLELQLKVSRGVEGGREVSGLDRGHGDKCPPNVCLQTMIRKQWSLFSQSLVQCAGCVSRRAAAPPTSKALAGKAGGRRQMAQTPPCT